MNVRPRMIQILGNNQFDSNVTNLTNAINQASDECLKAMQNQIINIYHIHYLFHQMVDIIWDIRNIGKGRLMFVLRSELIHQILLQYWKHSLLQCNNNINTLLFFFCIINIPIKVWTV